MEKLLDKLSENKFSKSVLKIALVWRFICICYQPFSQTIFSSHLFLEKEISLASLCKFSCVSEECFHWHTCTGLVQSYHYHILTSYTHSNLILNLSFFDRILETAFLFASVLTDLASCIISFVIFFGSLSLNKSFLPTWIIFFVDNCNSSYLQFLPKKSVWQ